jgi:glutamine cyclotransferase
MEELHKNPVKYKTELKGLFITNEGNFMYGNASLSFYDPISKKILNDVFYNANGKPLGDVAQSITIHGDLAYIVVNNSSVIFAIDKNTFKVKGLIKGLTSPRYIHFISDTKAYVTDLYAKAITIIDPSTFSIVKRIDVSNGIGKQHPTEQMVQYKNFVYINCWSYDNKILVLDTNTDKIVDEIEVPIQPTSLVMDKFNKIWTVTDGGYAGSPYGHEAPSLVCIDAETRKIERKFTFNFGDWPSEVCLNGAKDSLYFINNDIWRLDVKTEEFPKEPFIASKNTKYYGLTVNPNNGDVYLADAIDYVQRGIVYRYSSKGKELDRFQVGIIPGAFCFKK